LYIKKEWLGVVFVIAALAGCGADPSSQPDADDFALSNKVTGSVREWDVEVSASRAKAGEVTFAIANFGSIQHEFLVTKTPVNEAKVLTLELEAGTYELLCNIEGHYANGMHHMFVVE